MYKNLNKYYLYIRSKKKIKFFDSHNNKKEIFINLKKNIKLKSDFEIILITIKKVKYNPKQPIKMIFGPIKVEINFFQITNRGAIKTNKFETRNNHLFYTTEHLEKNNIKLSDFKKIIKLAIDDKLEKRLLAPKTINQIK
jgi:hypothetical protein